MFFLLFIILIFIIYFFIVLLILFNSGNTNKFHSNFISSRIHSTVRNKIINKAKSIFSNAQKIYSNSSISIYQADASGENFIFALKNTDKAYSLNDIEILNEKSKKFHIHNKILITNYPITESDLIYIKLHEYKIDTWNISKLIPPSKDSDSHYSSSILKTSDTSDDTCEIDLNSNDPIQDGKLNTHSLFSLFGNKTEHL